MGDEDERERERKREVAGPTEDREKLRERRLRQLSTLRVTTGAGYDEGAVYPAAPFGREAARRQTLA